MINEFMQQLLKMDRVNAKTIIQKHPDNVFQVIEDLIIPTLDLIGKGWEEGSVALSQVYMAGRIVEEIIDDLLPPDDPDRINQPKVAIAVLEDHHILGKRIVYSLLRASGYEIMDFGQVSVDELVDLIIEKKVEIILISTLMLQSALLVKDVSEKLTTKNYKCKIIVGGAPFQFDDLLYKEVKADGQAVSLQDTLKLIDKIVMEVR